jgi:hypothetical protein
LQSYDKPATAASGEPKVMSGWLLSVTPGTPSSFVILDNDKEEKFIVDANGDITFLGKGKIAMKDLEIGNWVDVSYVEKDKEKVSVNIVMHNTKA